MISVWARVSDAEPLAELVPYVLLPEGHPLAERSALTLEALACEPLILLDLEPSRDYFLSLFRARGLEPRIGQRTARWRWCAAWSGTDSATACSRPNPPTTCLMMAGRS